MPIISAQSSFTGLSGVIPNLLFIDTKDTVATITNPGYLNSIVHEGFTVSDTDMAFVSTGSEGTVLLAVSITGISPNLVYSLVAPISGGGAIFTGNVQAGSSGIAGHFISFPPTAASGFLALQAADSPGNFTTTITNAAMGQNTTFTIPDPGVAAASFLLDAGPGNLVTDYEKMIPIEDMMLAAGGGAFVLTRNAQGNWSQLHTAAANTSILGFDITEQLRVAAGRGFELTSFDVVYSIATLALVAHSVTLATTVFANNIAVAVTNVAITSVLATATQAQPYVTNSTVNAPAFTNPAAGTAVKQVIEVTVNAAATSVYNLYGINLRFTKSIK